MSARSGLEIVIIGAGVFGAWIALLCSRAGHRVTLVERFGPANEQSSSTGESRIIRSAYGSDKIYTLLARRSLRLWTEFFREQKCVDLFRRTGVLWMADGTQPSLRQARFIFEELAIEHDWLEAADVHRRYPQIQVPAESIALFEPNAGALLAEDSVGAVVKTALRSGTRFEVAEVTAPSTDNTRLRWVETKEGKRISGELFVFATGSWLPKLFGELRGIIRPTRQELFFFDPPEGSSDFQPGSLPVWVDQIEPRIGYGFPDFGSGLKVGFHRLGPDFDPDLSSRAIDEGQISEAAEYIQDRFPEMQDMILHSSRVCHYENTQNGDFLIDRYPGMTNVWLVGGGSGHGFKHAPAIGEYVLNAIDGERSLEPRFSLAAKPNSAQSRVL